MKCRVPGCPFSTTYPLAMQNHAWGHKNDFERLVGRRPDDYDEVISFFGGELEITTLTDYQTTIPTYS